MSGSEFCQVSGRAVVKVTDWTILATGIVLITSGARLGGCGTAGTCSSYFRNRGKLSLICDRRCDL